VTATKKAGELRLLSLGRGQTGCWETNVTRKKKTGDRRDLGKKKGGVPPVVTREKGEFEGRRSNRD